MKIQLVSSGLAVALPTRSLNPSPSINLNEIYTPQSKDLLCVARISTITSQSFYILYHIYFTFRWEIPPSPLPLDPQPPIHLHYILRRLWFIPLIFTELCQIFFGVFSIFVLYLKRRDFNLYFSSLSSLFLLRIFFDFLLTLFPWNFA